MKGKLIIILALISGLLAAFLAYIYMSDVEKRITNAEYVEVFTAAYDLPADTVLKQDMLVTKEIPVIYKHRAEVTELDELLGYLTLVDLKAGDSILSNQVISRKDADRGLSYIVPAGRRAMTVSVDEVSGVAGLLLPGDQVDVLTVIEGGTTEKRNYTALVLQDIEVLAVDTVLNHAKSAAQGKTDYTTVTLAVTMTEANKLLIADTEGRIRILLRAPDNEEKTSLPSIHAENLLNR